MTSCIVNVADGVHVRAQNRLIKSINIQKIESELLTWTNEFPRNSPNQQTAPWGFKVYAIKNAFDKEYDEALWIDANGIVIRDLKPIFNHIKKYGYYFHSQYHATVGEWSSDLTLSNLELTRDEALKIPEISAFCFGLSRTHPMGVKIFKELRKYCDDLESFRGSPMSTPWKSTLNNQNQCISKNPQVLGHRHDQTILSILAHKEKCILNTTGILNYVDTSTAGHKYRKFIPPWIKIIQNRDIKFDIFLDMVDKYNNESRMFSRYKIILASTFVGLMQILKVYIRKFKFKFNQT